MNERTTKAQPTETEEVDRRSLRDEIQRLYAQIEELRKEDAETLEVVYRQDERIARLERAVGE